MNQFLEAVGIALNAIWSNKLRSFLTVLGNIVAVTSIIAVVSLIQGMNAYVTDAIVGDMGADTFSVQRFPITHSDEEFDKVRANPRVTMDDGDAIRRYSDKVAAVAARRTARRRCPTVTRSSKACPCKASRVNSARSRLSPPSAAA